MPKQSLAVYANPYLHLDHEGRLAGACQLDPAMAGGFLRHIGASLDPERTKADPSRDHDTDPRGGTNLDTVWRFSDDLQTIPQTAHHFDRIRHKELFLADANGGVPWFALADARLRAIALWRACYGKEPPGMSEWSSQYPLDEQVAQVAAKLAEKRKVDAAKADENKRAAEKAEADAKKAAEEAKRSREESHREALAALGLPPDHKDDPDALTHELAGEGAAQ